MLENIFKNMQPVVKNLLIINVLFFLAKFIFERQGIYLGDYLGLYYVDSPAFQPFQLVTHFFMHADFRHILFNMFALVVFGNMLEKVLGAKRFLIFYFITALGAAFLDQLVKGIELYQLNGTFFPDIHEHFTILSESFQYDSNYAQHVPSFKILSRGSVGASGAIFGLFAAVAMYFPNTEMMLYFAFRIKMKWLALGAGVYEVFSIYQNNPDDSVAHFAHVGGALFGFILVKIWQKDKSQFY